jgi:hypothetical protein
VLLLRHFESKSSSGVKAVHTGLGVIENEGEVKA